MKKRDSSTVTTLEEAREELAAWTAELDDAETKASKHQHRAARARSFIEHYRIKIEQLSLPVEPDEGRYVSFVKAYRGNPKRYVYAAVRGGDRWWVTGDSPRTRHGLTWSQLIDFVRDGNVLLPQDPRPMVDEADAADLLPPF